METSAAPSLPFYSLHLFAVVAEWGGEGGDKGGEAWAGKRKRGRGWRGGLDVAADVFEIRRTFVVTTLSDSSFSLFLPWISGFPDFRV